jgi:cytosine/adenosine deaminase-related metal-dependent hydrolase
MMVFDIWQDAVSNLSKSAAGFTHAQSLVLQKGDPADFVIVHGNDSIHSVVLNPSYERTVIKSGRIVASRTTVDSVAET